MVKTHGRLESTAGARWAAWFCACLAAACSSASGPKVGQSGSEGVAAGGGSAVRGPCSQHGAARRVTVLAKRGGKATLRVEETLHGSLPLAPGEVFEGTRYDDTFACSLGCGDVDVGEQALALYAGP